MLSLGQQNRHYTVYAVLYFIVLKASITEDVVNTLCNDILRESFATNDILMFVLTYNVIS
jgi:hypothetical protein